MPAYSFKSQFADDVESGEKRSTIRSKRKRPTKPGDTLYLYTGMRTKACCKLREEVCRRVRPIKIFDWGLVRLNNRWTPLIEAKIIAKKDGFISLWLFLDFFEQQYGLPFEGVLIEW